MLKSLKLFWLKALRKYHTIMLCYYDYMSCKYERSDRCGLYYSRMAYKHFSDEIKLNIKIRYIEEGLA